MNAPSWRQEDPARTPPSLDERDYRAQEREDRGVEHAGGAAAVAADRSVGPITLECSNRLDCDPGQEPRRWSGEGRDLPDGSFEITDGAECPGCGQVGELL